MQAAGMACADAPLRPRTRGEVINWSLPRRGSASGPGSKYQYMRPQFPVSVNVRPVSAGPGAEFSSGANTSRRASASPMAGPYPAFPVINTRSSTCLPVPSNTNAGTRGRSNSLSIASASLPRSSSTGALARAAANPTSHLYYQQQPPPPPPRFNPRHSVSFAPPVANSSRPRRHSFQAFPPRSYRQYHARRHKSAQSLPPTIHEMESDSGLKRRDTTKGPPLRILSLDGGGVRGYSMIIILQELMHRTYVEIEGRAPRRHEIPKPCDHFDLIVGTGTGGLIALMLGRLRLDLEQCKELYVRMTRMVFETDKTIAGIPYRHTLFKASMLEQAIKESVREHTVSEDEGNDGTPTSSIVSPLSPKHPRRHASNASVVSFSARSPAAQMARPAFRGNYGDPDTLLYDSRENRTKTAVTAVYKGTRKGGEPAMLRSYDSRKEPAPESECKIWEAGRATSAIGLAFKPIRIGQSIFHDDGAGTFNPSPQALDEATVNEWPGRDVGVFVSIGTGRRPKGTDSNSHVWYEGFMGDFADARRKLIAKIEGCEAIHDYMKNEHLMKRGVNVENYYRLNVEVGVGEFGMNEWHRLSEISTGTRAYMRRPDEQRMIQESSTKLAKINRAKQRYERLSNVPEVISPPASISSPLAVELPGDFPPIGGGPLSPTLSDGRESYDSGVDRLSLPSANGNPNGNTPSPRSSDERSRPHTSNSASPRYSDPNFQKSPPRPTSEDPDRLISHAPTPAQYRNAAGIDKIIISSIDEHPRRPQSAQGYRPVYQQKVHRIEPPPLPPKTPLPEGRVAPSRRGTAPLPYPDDDQPPPAVNMARKPDLRSR